MRTSQWLVFWLLNGWRQDKDHWCYAYCGEWCWTCVHREHGFAVDATLLVLTVWLTLR